MIKHLITFEANGRHYTMVAHTSSLQEAIDYAASCEVFRRDIIKIEPFYEK